MTETVGCHLCCGKLEEFDDFSDLYQVTSDCRPWGKGGHLSICIRCSTVQKPVSHKWQRAVKDIYNGYDIYKQAGGLEQRAFDQTSGNNEARSKQIVSWLIDLPVPKQGKLLDIGCGNGSFLKEIAYQFLIRFIPN